MSLPDAILRDPACGACGGELDMRGDGMVCDDCKLWFHPDTLAAEFLTSYEPCGEPCDNWWHGEGRIKATIRFECRPCQLPAGHNPAVHWRGCVELRDSPAG